MFESCLRNYKMDDKPTRLSSIFLYPLTHHSVSTVPSNCISKPILSYLYKDTAPEALSYEAYGCASGVVSFFD